MKDPIYKFNGVFDYANARTSMDATFTLTPDSSAYWPGRERTGNELAHAPICESMEKENCLTLYRKLLAAIV